MSVMTPPPERRGQEPAGRPREKPPRTKFTPIAFLTFEVARTGMATGARMRPIWRIGSGRARRPDDDASGRGDFGGVAEGGRLAGVGERAIGCLVGW